MRTLLLDRYGVTHLGEQVDQPRLPRTQGPLPPVWRIRCEVYVFAFGVLYPEPTTGAPTCLRCARGPL